jgi:hypothetical protein
MSVHLPTTIRARALAAVVLLLTVAALYETAIALQIIPMGKVAGKGAAGEWYVLWVALLAMLLGSLISLSRVASRRVEWRSVALLVAPAAAAFVAARFFTFDDYYLPTLRRMSDGGNVAGSWIVALVVLALLAAFVTRFLPRIGTAATSFVLLASAVLAVGVGIGH